MEGVGFELRRIGLRQTEVGPGEVRALTRFLMDSSSISKVWTVRLSSVSATSASRTSADCEVTTVVLSSICRVEGRV